MTILISVVLTFTCSTAHPRGRDRICTGGVALHLRSSYNSSLWEKREQFYEKGSKMLSLFCLFLQQNWIYILSKLRYITLGNNRHPSSILIIIYICPLVFFWFFGFLFFTFLIPNKKWHLDWITYINIYISSYHFTVIFRSCWPGRVNIS